MIVVLGEIGGRDEYTLVEALAQGKITKPVRRWGRVVGVGGWIGSERGVAGGRGTAGAAAAGWCACPCSLRLCFLG